MKKIAIYYFLSLFFLLSIFSAGVVDSQDGFQYLAVARNIYYKGKPTTPPYEYNTRKNVHMSVTYGKYGDAYSLTGLGFSLAMLPAVALTDLVYKIYGVDPPIHFPLENDWLILMTASFTNAFFGAVLGVVLLFYLIELDLSKKQALLISLIGLFTTNILVYTKHSFVHMMFTVFLFTSFFLIKKHFNTKRNIYLLLAGVSFGITSITYNQTFLLAIIPLGFYLLMLGKYRLNFPSIKLILIKLIIFFLAFFPFILVYIWFENLRANHSQNYTNLVAVIDRGLQPVRYFRTGLFLEGLYGQLVSPGRSIFLYSPILLLIIFFWNRIKKVVNPEFLTFVLLSAIYVIFYSTQYSGGAVDQGMAGLWHGELSWGPRYLIPLIPMGILVVGSIYKSFSRKVKYLLFYPLVVIGIYIEILGILIPYQTKLFNLQSKVFLNGTEYYASLYSNLIPRYTPVITMSKNLVKLVQNFPNTFDHGIYNVKYYDGIDFPFNVGSERWRVIEGKGYISFDSNSKDPVKELTFGVINHPVSEASESATVQFILNNQLLSDKSYQLNVTQRELIKLPVNPSLIKPKDNQLMIEVTYDDPLILAEKKQILGLQSFDINGQRQNMESIDVPYVSALGIKVARVTYQNWGGSNQDPWRLWDLHTQMYERLPDFWWIRNLYYWDIPKKWILIPFIFNLLGVAYFGYKIFKIKD